MLEFENKKRNEMIETDLAKLVEKLQLENSQLKLKIEQMTSDFANAVANAVKQATEPLLMEIERLKAIINKDSSNSSKPPSTDGFKTIPNLREKSDKPSGGQKGHGGHRLLLPENIEELEKEGFVEKRIEDHTNGEEEYISKYKIDVETKVIITEYRYAKDAKLPEDLHNEVSYGNKLKATVINLTNEGIIAQRRLSGIISEMTHGIINLSDATIENFQNDFARKLEESGELELIKQDVLNNKIMHVDDTSVKCTEKIIYSKNEEENIEPVYEKSKGKSLRVTIRTHSNEESTFYTVNPKKDNEGVVRDGILPNFHGNLCHDHEKKFYGYGGAHGTCCQHLVRDLKGLTDLCGCAWAEKMRKYMLEMNNHKNEDIKKGIEKCEPKLLLAYEQEYDHLLDEGQEELKKLKKKQHGRAKFNAMLNRLTNYKDCYLLFMRDYEVPFTNNMAERDLRLEKTKQKVSGAFRSWNGVVTHVKIRSFLSTIKKRGKNLLSSISKIISKEPVLSN